MKYVCKRIASMRLAESIMVLWEQLYIYIYIYIIVIYYENNYIYRCSVMMCLYFLKVVVVLLVLYMIQIFIMDLNFMI